MRRRTGVSCRSVMDAQSPLQTSPRGGYTLLCSLGRLKKINQRKDPLTSVFVRWKTGSDLFKNKKKGRKP